MATGHAVQIPHSLLDPVRTLTATIAAELGETVEGGTHYRVLFVIGSLLMIISLVVNVTADLIVSGVRGQGDARERRRARALRRRSGRAAEAASSNASPTRSRFTAACRADRAAAGDPGLSGGQGVAGAVVGVPGHAESRATT